MSFRRTILVSIILFSPACGGGSPTTPTTPTIVQAGGLWNATATLASVTGGECVGALYTPSIGTSARYTFAVTQTGSNLTATSTSLDDGTTCQFTGTAGTNTISLNGTSCSAAILKGFRCSNGAVRDTQVTNLAVFATINGNAASGSYAQTSNVYVGGTSTGVGVLGIDVNSIAPGALKTRLLDELLANDPDQVGRDFYNRMAKLKIDGSTPLETGAALSVFLGSAASDGITGRLLSAQWDPWQTLPEHTADLAASDIYTLRRIVPKDRGRTWGNDR